VINTTEKQLSRQRQVAMKKRRLGPKHADRRRKPKRSVKHIRGRWKHYKAALEKPVRQRKRPKEADEMAILLRLINILGLVLLMMSVSMLSNHENLKEIIDLARKLFILLP
jgi:hypothetical protein